MICMIQLHKQKCTDISHDDRESNDEQQERNTNSNESLKYVMKVHEYDKEKFPVVARIVAQSGCDSKEDSDNQSKAD